jgi:PAS domain-containing protein
MLPVSKRIPIEREAIVILFPFTRRYWCMKNNINQTHQSTPVSSEMGDDVIKRIWEESWTYIKTVVDVVREPVVILDKELRVMSANEPFYRTFQVEHADTEGKVIYELGDGQWNVPALRKLLEDILPNNTFFKGFEVTHDFPVIGKKMMVLNAREIHARPLSDDHQKTLFPPIILLAIEDVTEIMLIADTLVGKVNTHRDSFGKRMLAIEAKVDSLQKEITSLKRAQKTAKA